VYVHYSTIRNHKRNYKKKLRRARKSTQKGVNRKILETLVYLHVTICVRDFFFIKRIEMAPFSDLVVVSTETIMNNLLWLPRTSARGFNKGCKGLFILIYIYIFNLLHMVLEMLLSDNIFNLKKTFFFVIFYMFSTAQCNTTHQISLCGNQCYAKMIFQTSCCVDF